MHALRFPCRTNHKEITLNFENICHSVAVLRIKTEHKSPSSISNIHASYMIDLIRAEFTYRLSQ